MKYLTTDDVLNWWQIGNLLYANVKINTEFLYGERVARKVAWRFYWLKAI